MLERVIAVIGPPAAGKTTVTTQLSQLPGTRVFRLPEHVPDRVQAATPIAAQLGWVDNFTAITSVHGYIEAVARENEVRTLLLDDFPSTGTQVSLFVSVLGQLASDSTISAVELIAHPEVLQHRARTRRLVHRGDDPVVYKARMRRYHEMSSGVRRAFVSAGITLRRLDSSRSLEDMTQELAALIACSKAAKDVS
jgi:adenylate kinase